MDSSYHHQSPNQAYFTNFQPYGVANYESIRKPYDLSQLSSYPYPQSKPNLPPASPTTNPPPPPTTELDSLTLKPSPPPCPHCLGQRWNFTAYFHNTRYFPSPPHGLLGLVEKSYVLKGRLQSLLVTYAVQGIQREEGDEAERGAEVQIRAWEGSVEELVMSVVGCVEGGKGRDGVVREALERVRGLTTEMMGRLRGFVAGVEERAMCLSACKELVANFRKVWESVWIAIAISRASEVVDADTIGVSA